MTTGPTWHTGDADNVSVAGVEAVEQVRGLSGIQNHNLGGGVGASAHPHTTGHLILNNQLLLFLPFFPILTAT